MHRISHNIDVSRRHAMNDSNHNSDPSPQIHSSNVKIITKKNPLKTYEQFQQEQEQLNQQMDEYQKRLDMIGIDNQIPMEIVMASSDNTDNTDNAENVESDNVKNNLDYIKSVIDGHNEMIHQIQSKIEDLKSLNTERIDKIVQIECQFNDYKKITDERVEKLAKLFLSIGI